MSTTVKRHRCLRVYLWGRCPNKTRSRRRVCHRCRLYMLGQRTIVGEV